MNLEMNGNSKCLKMRQSTLQRLEKFCVRNGKKKDRNLVFRTMMMEAGKSAVLKTIRLRVVLWNKLKARSICLKQFEWTRKVHGSLQEVLLPAWNRILKACHMSALKTKVVLLQEVKRL